MDQTEWKCSEKYPGKYVYYNKTRKLQKSLIYNEDKNATVIHHLRDTEEQRNYNDTHYELWGFEIDENGEEHFEYGKYVIFVTKEEHTKIHSMSEETRKKISISCKYKGMYRKCHTRKSKHLMSISKSKQIYSEERKQKMSNSMKEKWKDPAFHEKMVNAVVNSNNRSSEDYSKMALSLWQDDEYRAKQIIAHNWTSWFGWLQYYFSKKERKEELRKKKSEAMKKWWQEHPVTDEFREKMRNLQLGNKNSMYRKHLSKETKRKLSLANKGKTRTDEQKKNMSDAQLARYKENPVSTDTKAKMSESAKHRKTQPKRTNIQKNNAKARLSLIADAYKVYKENGGEANWNEFQKLYKDIKNE